MNDSIRPTPPKRNPDKTREAILMAGVEEIHRHGFQAAGLDTILAKAGVTKGALYHHFRNKAALGYAVVDEVIRHWVVGTWTDALNAGGDPIDQLQGVLEHDMGSASEEAIELGCPLYNLIQEMSPIDEGFRTRLNRVIEDWRDAIATALRQGQDNGFVRKDIDPRATATFFIASVEGSIGMVKASRSRQVAAEAVKSMNGYLDSLRAQPIDSPSPELQTT